MIYVYAPRTTIGVWNLITALGAQRLRRFDGIDFWKNGNRVTLEKADSIIYWGGCGPEFEGVKTINASDTLKNRHYLARMLASYNLGPSVSDNKKLLGNPIGRTNNSKGGADLIYPPNRPDFYVQLMSFAEEYRFHVVGDKILFGKMVPTNPYAVSYPRSYKTGWEIKYGGNGLKALRDLAMRVKDLIEVDFAAVNIGKLTAGGYRVVSVNLAPSLTNEVTGFYVDELKRMLNETKPTENANGSGDSEHPF